MEPSGKEQQMYEMDGEWFGDAREMSRGPANKVSYFVHARLPGKSAFFFVFSGGPFFQAPSTTNYYDTE